jgi:large subunit ribosomal protein L28
MARRCAITGKGVQTGNNVSHAHNKTRRCWLPNLQVASLHSEALGQTVRMRLSTRAISSIDKKGGLDAYLMGTSNNDLTVEARKLKRRIQRAAKAKEASA